MIVALEADSESGLSYKMFLVLDPTTLKENINEASEVGGTLADDPAPGSIDEDVAMTSIFAATSGQE